MTRTTGTIPFFPPDLFHEDRDTLLRLLYEIGTGREQRFILGEHTRRFETALAEGLGVADVVACASGTGGCGSRSTATTLWMCGTATSSMRGCGA